MSSIAAAVLALHEEGVARLVFDKVYASFEGVLINGNEEVFALRGIPSSFASAVSGMNRKSFKVKHSMSVFII